MLRSKSFPGTARLGCWWLATTAIACLGLSGCTAIRASDLDFSRVEGLRNAPGHTWAGSFRSADNDLMPHAVTNKGMQIERSLGVQ